MEVEDKVIDWLEGLSKDDWREFHSDSEVSNIAKAAVSLLKNQTEQPRVSVSISPLVTELLVARYGLSTTTDTDKVRQVEQEIILEGLRLQNRSHDW